MCHDAGASSPAYPKERTLPIMQTKSERWSRDAVSEVYRSPILDLIHRAASVHRLHHDAGEIQVCTLLSVKTGGCPEDCGYCAQSAHFSTPVKSEKLIDADAVESAALKARDSGSTRFCMGAAWRQVRDGKEFDEVLDMVQRVSSMGLEVCCTLGMLKPEQARRLKQAGLYAYNHNLDTGAEYYEEVVTTRSYADRLETIGNVASAGISLCCGGILGLGEGEKDRIDLLHTLANLDTPPESIPVNALVPIEGTPLAEQAQLSVWDMVRAIATARILVPQAMVRLAAGRDQLSDEDHALCFLAGANSIFSGEKLLTTPHPGADHDARLLDLFGLKPRQPYKAETETETEAAG
jgi:biotin synthase